MNLGDSTNRWGQALSRCIDAVLAVLLLAMVVMVFGNVVLRYGFNTGITFSEELSRWAFVWLTFLGAVVAVKDNAHLGTDMLISRLGTAGKKLCLLLAQLCMLGCVALVFWGSWLQVKIGLGSEAPVTGLSMAWVPAAGLVFAMLAALFHLHTLWRLAAGKMTEAELIGVQESEELAHTLQQRDPGGNTEGNTEDSTGNAKGPA
jgi:TRAP-type transport system small permease protein